MTELAVRPKELPALAALFAPGRVADPYPEYARWHAQRPVSRLREDLLVFSRYQDCAAVLGDPAFGHALHQASPVRTLWPGAGHQGPARWGDRRCPGGFLNFLRRPLCGRVVEVLDVA